MYLDIKIVNIKSHGKASAAGKRGEAARARD
jgi:hypothetical protein